MMNSTAESNAILVFASAMLRQLSDALILQRKGSAFAVTGACRLEGVAVQCEALAGRCRAMAREESFRAEDGNVVEPCPAGSGNGIIPISQGS